MKRRWMLFAQVGLVLGLALLVGPPGEAAQEPVRGGALRYGTVTEVPGIDPHVYVGTAGKLITEAVYNSLLGFNQKGELVPTLAESWENPDPLTFVFKLRRGVKFHKGQSFTARDVKFSLERILDPATGATLRSNLLGIQIETPDDYTIRIRLKEPDATLAVVMGMAESAILSEEWMKTNPNVKVEANGTGPFILAEHDPKVRILLKRNPTFFERGLPYLDQAEIRMISNDGARVNALRSRAVDMIDFVPWKDIDTLQKERGLEVQAAGGAFMNLWFNTSKKPFDNPRVRRAVAFAIDREAVSTAAFFGHGTPLYGPPTAPDSWWYNADFAHAFPYNKEKARQLLAEAGYPNGFKVELAVYQGLAIYTQTAQIVQANLKEVGIDADIKLLEWATLVDRKSKGAYDFLIWGVNIKMPDPDGYAYYFGSDSTYWAKPVGFRDPKMEELLKAGRTALDRAMRKGIYRDLEARILELSPWVFINWRDQAEAYVSAVKGFVQLGGALSEDAPGIALKTLWLAR
jgi:peptide/nickel transport system substrate-binding protein/glutathione transport system substrate-binding protein